MDDGQPGLLEHFADLPDPRDGPLYPLAEILLLALCAILCGAEDWTAVAMWGQAHREWLQRYLPFEAGLPSHDTIGRVFAMLDAKRFEACFVGWMQSVCPALDGLEIAIDGKTVRRSHARRLGKRAIHLVSAFADRLGVMLGQVKTDDKSNEITAIPALLEALAIKGCLVSIDAMGNQRAIARQIIEAQGDYVLAVKANQRTQHEAIRDFFEDTEALGYAHVPHDTYESVEKDHGRIETRRCVATECLDWLEPKLKHPGMRSIVMIEALREIEGKRSVERRYYVSSWPADARRLAQAVRRHWGIENRLHWCLDVAFNEDQCRVRTGYADQNFAILRRIVLNLLRLDTSVKAGLKNRRLLAGWNADYRAKLLGLKPV